MSVSVPVAVPVRAEPLALVAVLALVEVLARAKPLALVAVVLPVASRSRC